MDQVMGKTAFLTVDVDEDRREGVMHALEILDRLGVKATFFIVARIAEEDPGLVKEIVERGHEVGSHGYDHSRLDKLLPRDAEERIKRSLEALRRFYPVRSFRAPYMRLPRRLLKTLAREGVEVDSSLRAHLGRGGTMLHLEEGIVRLPVTYNEYLLRMPWGMQKMFHSSPPKVVVFKVTPPARPEHGVAGHEPVARVILHYLERGYRFLRVEDARDLYKISIGVGGGRRRARLLSLTL